MVSLDQVSRGHLGKEGEREGVLGPVFGDHAPKFCGGKRADVIDSFTADGPISAAYGFDGVGGEEVDVLGGEPLGGKEIAERDQLSAFGELVSGLLTEFIGDGAEDDIGLEPAFVEVIDLRSTRSSSS